MITATGALLPITAACVIASASLLGAAHDLEQLRDSANDYHDSLRVLGYEPGAPTPPAAPHGGQWGWGTVGHYALEAAKVYDTGIEGLPVHPPRLAEGMVLLHDAARRDEALRMRLPQETRDSLDSVDPEEIARGLAALRDALQSDIGLYAMIPHELRVGMELRHGYLTSSCFSIGCLGGGATHGAYDYEAYVRSKLWLGGNEPLLYEFCAPASEELAAQFPWVKSTSMSWASFDSACQLWHSEIVYKAILASLPTAVSERCRGLIDAGWVVDSWGWFHHPDLGPGEMARVLEAESGTAGRYDLFVGSDGAWRLPFMEECAPGYEDAARSALFWQTYTPPASPNVPGPTPWEGTADLI